MYEFSFKQIKSVLFFCLLLLVQVSAAQFIGFEISNRRGKTTFPFEKVNNLIVVPVLLNNQLPLNFILDTGVRTTILTDKAISDIINISYDRVVTVSGVGHIKELNAYLASNVSISMPDITGLGQSLIVLEEDYLELKNHLGTNVHGIIGYEFFNHFVVKIDYDQQLITVYDPKVFKPGRKFTAVPFTIELGRPYIGVNVTQHNDTVIHAKLLLDSGASHGLLLETDTNENISVPDDKLQTIIGWGLGGEMAGSLGRIKNLTIDKFEFKEVLVSFAQDYSNPEVTKITGRNGSIGGDLLSRFSVIFDYSTNTVYLKKSKNFNYPFEFNLGGIDLITTGADYNSFMIINVIENSPAYQAGVRTGDMILAINGKFTTDLTLSEINSLLRLRAGNKITLMLNRNSAIKKVSFRLRRLI